MKNIIKLIIFAAIILSALYFDGGCRVWEIKNPSEIFIDVNRNLIYDEKEPVKISGIHYVNADTDFEKYPFLKQLTQDEIFFLENKAVEAASDILKNRYVKIKNGDIFVRNKGYKEEILLSKYVFDESAASQKALIDNIKSINLDDYVILNIKNRKYHKLNCPAGRKGMKFRIVKRKEAERYASACRSCILPPDAEKEMKEAEIQAETYYSGFKNRVYQSPDLKIFFIDLNKNFKPDNSCTQAACSALKKEIDSAQYTIDAALYGISGQPEIINALINAHKRGVKIRRVYDWSEKKYYEDTSKIDRQLIDYKTDEEWDKNKKSALMHNKYFIFDGSRVFTGSSNISGTDLSEFNANYAVLIHSKEIAEKYTQDFEQMYSGIFHKGKKPSMPVFYWLSSGIKIKPVFSPQDDIIKTEIIPLINSAEKYIYMPAFFITHKGMADALINAAARGVRIKIIIDASSAGTPYSVHKKLRHAGIKVKTENYAGKMHAKSIIIDDKYSVTGSMNFTKSGSSKNDENAVIIESGEAAAFMKETFLHLWGKIPEKYEFIDPKAESKESIGSCLDGIDNDFDGKIDAMDEGCKF